MHLRALSNASAGLTIADVGAVVIYLQEQLEHAQRRPRPSMVFQDADNGVGEGAVQLRATYMAVHGELIPGWRTT